MKKLISALLCFVILFVVFPSCAANEETVALSEKYVLKNGYLFNIIEKTVPSEFLENEPFIVSLSSENQYISTGDIATDVNGNEYKIVIFGDADGDGEIKVYDYFLVKRAYFNNVNLEPVFFEACQENDEVTVFDYILVKRHVLGNYDISKKLHKQPIAAPENPENPDTPDTPENPENPDTPENPENPDTPDTPDTPENPDLPTEQSSVKIAYIPLDNRPVNKERVEYLAAAAGFELLIPEEDLYRTALDNMTPNSDGSTIGNRKELLKWLKSVESECDYFVISLDQMISGGLVGSRYLSNTDLTFEMEVSDYIIELAKTKHVILFDTVMRLASTVGYQGYDLTTYNTLRSYGKKARAQLKGENLTVENIVSGYKYDANGNYISVNVSNDKLERYLASRERKLRVIDYLLTNASEDIERIYIGVDDSSPETTIQTNEINYISSIGGENLTLFAGADELGLMGIAAIATDRYGQAECNVTYYGEGKSWSADEFDTATLEDCINKHFDSIGATRQSDDENALQVLVLTRSNNVSYYADQLMKQAVANVNAGIPTCIIDASNNTQYLPQKVLDYKYDIAKLLGYSNWNTVANATGISLSNAVARYSYLFNTDKATEDSNKAFLKTLTFGLIKDISYKRKNITNLNDSSAYGPATIVSRINASEIMVEKGKFASHGKVSVSNFRYPWNRTFEAVFDIAVA